jgi:hypothetical protein
VWANQLTRALLRGLVRLNFLDSSDNPSENGIILWDDTNEWPVISKNGEFLEVILYDRHPYLVPLPDSYTPPQDGIIFWDATNEYPVVSKDGVMRQIVMADGYYMGGVTTNQTVTTANEINVLTFTASAASGISNGTPASEIVFSEGGVYKISFSAQISSTSGSDVRFYFWPRINGSDVSGSTMVNTLHNNGASVVTTRTATFVVEAGDALEAMWTVDSTAGFLEAAASTAFCPAAPAATISITRVSA